MDLRNISDLPLLTAAEQHQLLIEWNNSQTDYPNNTCIHQLFESLAEKTPDAIAVIFENQQLTYQQLNHRANQLGHYLRSLGVKPEVMVGICVERSLEMIVAILAILKAGGAYVPLDTSYPEQRLSLMLTDSQVTVLLTQQHLLQQLPEHQASIVCLDRDWEDIATQAQDNLDINIHPDNLAYVIYTSGSTGKPKGVAMPHRPLVNLIAWQSLSSTVEEGSKTLQYTPISFDVSFQEIFATLTTGGTLVLISESLRREPIHLLQFLNQAGIERLFLPYVALQQLAEMARIEGIVPCSLHEVITAGEQLRITEAIAHLFRQLPNCTLHNHYGPSETHVVTAFTLANSPTDWSVLPPIGRPIANSQIYLLDSQLQLVPIGMPGEIYIGGIGIARGYLNRLDLTDARFIPNPFGRSSPAEEEGSRGAEILPNLQSPRLYKTGDLARYLPDGNIEYLGRIDNQVKIRGFRIELGEIEAALAQHPNIRETVVTTRVDHSENQRLVAYIIPYPEQTPSTHELRYFLKQKLPEYMLPSAFVLLDTLPLTPSGKIDRRALPAPDKSALSLSTNFVPPQNPTEEVLASIWTTVLHLEQVGIHDNFFELGGDSLLSTQVISRIRQTLQIEIPFQLLFENQTIATLAEAMLTATHSRSVDHSRSGNAQNQTIVQIVNRESAPLSFAQRGVWFLEQLEPNNSTYIVSNAHRLTGKLNLGVLQQSLDAIVVHHEALRTNFISSVDGVPLQVIGTPRSVELKEIKVTQDQVQFFLNQEVQHPFNLETDLMLRATLLQIDEQEHILLLVMHHIASDGWSIGILWQQLAAVYEAFLSGKPSPLTTLPIQYADFAVWQHQWLSGEILSGQINYWKTQLAGANTLLELPTDRPRPPVQTHQGVVQSLMLPQTLSASLKELSHQEGVTLFMTLLAAFGTILHRYTGQEDILIGSPIAGRNQVETEGLIGFFVNTLAIRANLSGNPSFRQLLSQVREVTLGAYSHQELPFEKLVEELHPERNLSHSPLFQVMFAFQNTPSQLCDFPGLTITPVEVHSGGAKFDLTLELKDTSEGIKGGIEYNTDLFDATTIARMLGHFQTLLAGIVANPEQHISDLPLLTAAEQHQLLVEWNNSQTDYPNNTCIHQLFESLAEKTPDAIAVIFENQQLTYQQLNHRANQLGHYLRTLGVKPEVLVGICVERSLNLIVGLLGILKAGGAYVPLDPSYPAERLAFILEDTQVSVLLTQKSLVEKLPGNKSHIVCLDTDWKTLNCQSESNPTLDTTPENLAYVMYTSGSTGKPKGVCTIHRGVVRLVKGIDYAKLDSEETFLQLAPISFDASTFEIWGSLLNGGRLVIFPAYTPSLQQLGQAIQHYQVTTLWLTAGLFHLVVDKGLEYLKPLRQLLAGGDILSVSHVQRFSQVLGECQLINGYGPTENTTFTCCYQIPQTAKLSNSVPIGRPIANTQVYILDSQLQAVPIGVPGELYISGDGLARGYLNRPEITDEKFIPNPFNNSKGDRLYKTGDLARYLSDGNIEFLGRLDNQVKIRGFRIELGEIEDAIAQYSGVQQTIVVVKEDGPNDKRLVAYIVPHLEQTPTKDELRCFLKEKLPDYMVPSAYVFLDTLPLTPNGKIDRRALPVPDSTRLDSENTYLAPRDQLEFQLIKIWEKVLGIQPIGVRDNFFSLGGHSLLAVRLFTQIEKAFQKNLPLTTLFESPTVEQLANILRSQQALSLWYSLVPIQPGGSRPPLFGIHNIYFKNLSRYLGLSQPIYALRYGMGELTARTLSLPKIEDLAAHYILEMRSLQPEGPYFLMGLSFGGVVAYEMAQQLVAQGQQIGLLALFDTYIENTTKSLPLYKSLYNLLQLSPRKFLRQAKDEVKRRFHRLRYGIQYLPHIHTDEPSILVLKAYTPKTYSGRVLLFKAMDEFSLIPSFDPPELGWSKFVDGMEIHEVHGSHIGILKEPHVQVVAEKLKPYLHNEP
ncbi:MAG: amino acid adenylation domain-containing protein [Nostoc sp.]